MSLPAAYHAAVMNSCVADILAEVRGADLPPDAVHGAADRIAALGDAAVPLLVEALGDEDEAVLAVAAGALRRLANPSLAQHLMRLLRSPDIGDIAKALLLGILEEAGMDIHDPSLVAAVVDLEGALLAEADGSGRHAPAMGASTSATGLGVPEEEP